MVFMWCIVEKNKNTLIVSKVVFFIRNYHVHALGTCKTMVRKLLTVNKLNCDQQMYYNIFLP